MIVKIKFGSLESSRDYNKLDEENHSRMEEWWRQQEMCCNKVLTNNMDNKPRDPGENSMEQEWNVKIHNQE